MNLVNISKLTKDDIEEIFAITDKIKENPNRFTQCLNGLCIVLFFPETSIRTRLTFEKGISNSGGKSILFPPSTLDKKEKIKDVMKYLENWADMIIVRHSNHEKVEEMAKHSAIPVINAMTSACHPCEILSDLYSFRELSKDYDTFEYTFVGENANILKTWTEAAEVLDLKLNHVFFESERVKDNNLNYSFHTELDHVIETTDVLLTDPIPEDERTKEYYEKYQINLSRLKKAKESILVNPCPPFCRNEEIHEAVIESKYFVGYRFKQNLVYVQQAIILKCLNYNLNDIK